MKDIVFLVIVPLIIFGWFAYFVNETGKHRKEK